MTFQQLQFLATPQIGAAPPSDACVELARRLSPLLRFGTSSWAYPGWNKLVYAAPYPATELAHTGLTAYAKHPLLRAVGVDRSLYAPIPAHTLREFADAVPTDFRFLVKAHDACTLLRFPHHARYKGREGCVNPHFLDAKNATDTVVRPLLEHFGERLGCLLWQFAPQDFSSIQGPRGFVTLLRRFFAALPDGVPHAVEVRNHNLINAEYAETLAAAGAVHCFNVVNAMPSMRTQAQALARVRFHRLVVRWMLHPDYTHESANAAFAPFAVRQAPDTENLTHVAWLIDKALAAGRPALVIVNNNAEGCAPRSIEVLAQSVIDLAAKRA